LLPMRNGRMSQFWKVMSSTMIDLEPGAAIMKVIQHKKGILRTEDVIDNSMTILRFR